MDAERIKAIIELSKASGACEIAVQTDDGSIRVRRRPRVAQAQPPSEPPRGAAAVEPGKPMRGPEPTVQVAGDERVVRAAHVGWFHRGAGPDEEPFVEVGDHVAAGQALGTIETLKMSNQVTSEVSGEIKQILVEDGMEVEYGQPLFVIQPDRE